MDALYVLYNDVINSLSNFLYTYILIILLVAGGIYFTVRTRFVQFRYLLESIRVVMQPSPDQANVSAFQTLMVSTASRTYSTSQMPQPFSAAIGWASARTSSVTFAI